MSNFIYYVQLCELVVLKKELQNNLLKSAGLYVTGQLSPMLCVYGIRFAP